VRNSPVAANEKIVEMKSNLEEIGMSLAFANRYHEKAATLKSTAFLPARNSFVALERHLLKTPSSLFFST
jgi:hypothetical protein|tara:strand:+ start:105 stop:314 length:210 start_codon:yes stop_codon:yes gene_type:complete